MASVVLGEIDRFKHAGTRRQKDRARAVSRVFDELCHAARHLDGFAGHAREHRKLFLREVATGTLDLNTAAVRSSSTRGRGVVLAYRLSMGTSDIYGDGRSVDGYGLDVDILRPGVDRLARHDLLDLAHVVRRWPASEGLRDASGRELY